MTPFASRVTLFLITLSLPSVCFADDKPQPAKLEAKIEIDAGTPEPSLSVTHHQVRIGKTNVKYTATAGTLSMKSDDGKTKADVFFIAYTRDGVADITQRPVTFTFNGGPGSSSVWLHLGCLGPQRVKLPDDASFAKPPGELIPNPHSLLDITDLVFIDPVSTGYSRPAKGEDKKQFHGYQEDLNSVGQFIHTYTTKNGRWMSPKYLCGESYGTLRAAGLAGHLRNRYYMELNGIVLVSSVLDFQTLRFSFNNALPNVLFLPTYTATAWYHKRLAGNLQNKPLRKVLDEVERFATDEYHPALLKGAAVSPEKRQLLAQKFARYTGLTPEYVERANLQVGMRNFAKELMRDTGRTVGRFDSRYVGRDRDGIGDGYEYDASGAAIFGPYTASMYHYAKTALKVEREDVYEILTSKVHPWSYKPFENRYVSSAETLRQAMTQNPYLKVYIANGYYDLATPYFATEYTFNTMPLPDDIRKNITMGYYEGGHMMYVHEPSLKKLRRELVKFYGGAEK